MDITKEQLRESFEKNVTPKLRSQISEESLEKGLDGMAGALKPRQEQGRGR